MSLKLPIPDITQARRFRARGCRSCEINAVTWLEPACALTRAKGDLTAGHVSASFLEAGLSIPLIKDGKLRALAVSASQRLPLLPDVPPFSEAAGAPDYEGVSWHMLLMPSKTPRPIAERLHTEMKRIMAAPDMREKIAAVGLIPNDSPSIEEMRGYIASEHVKWGALVKQLGLEVSQ